MKKSRNVTGSWLGPVLSGAKRTNPSQGGRFSSTYLSISVIAMLLLMAYPATLDAQTEWKGRPVVHAVEDQTAPSAARPTQPDFTIVVWQDKRGDGTEYDVYMQKIDTYTGLPMWLEPDGIPVCTESEDQKNPRAAYDSLGCVIVVWEDDRSGNTAVYAQRFSVATGERDVNWPTGGLPVCNLDSDCEHVRITGTADGAFISWLDYRNFNPQTSSNREVFAQYILSATASWPSSQSWVQDGIPATNGMDHEDQEHPEIARSYIWQNGKAGCAVTYQNRVQISGQWYWNVWVAGLDPTGIMEPDWGGSEMPLATYEADQLYPKIVCSGAEVTRDEPRAIVVWQDSREDPSTPLFNIIAQIVDEDGSMQSPSGDTICDVTETQQHPVLALWERPYNPTTSEPYLPFVTFAWEDLRDVQQQGVDIYAGQIDARNHVITNPYATTGDAIAYASTNESQVEIDIVPASSEAFLAWRYYNPTAAEYDIHYQELEVEYWQYGKPAGGWPVTEAKDNQNLPQVAGRVLVYEDNRRQSISNDNRSDWDIYCQTPGECVGPTAMDWRDMFADVHQEGDASHIRFTTDADFNTYVVWQKSTGDPAKQDVYVQKIDATGVPRWTNGGIKLNTEDFAQHPEVAISDVGGGAQVVWQQSNPVSRLEEIWYTKIDPTGTFDINPNVMENHPSEDVTHPMIVYTDVIFPVNGVPGDADIASEYSAYFGWTVGDNLFLGSCETGKNTVSWQITTGLQSGDWEHIVKLVSPPGRHLYAIGTGSNTPGGKKYCNTVGKFENGYPLLTECQTKSYIAAVDFGGIDIALDQRATGNSQDAIVVVALSNYPAFGAWLYAYWASAYYNSIGPGDVLIGAPMGLSRYSHPRLAADDIRVPNTYGGMMLVWDYEFPNASVQRHKVVTDKITYATGSYPPPIARCDPFANPIMPTNQEYSWPTNPEIAKVDAPNGVDTLSFIVWEGIMENCTPARPREVVGQWVVYNYFPGPQRGPQWPSEKQLGPGGGLYEQTLPLVQTSDANTLQVYWLDGRSGEDLVMGTRVWGTLSNGIYWAKDREDEAPTLPDLFGLGETFPNPISLHSGALSRVVVDVETEQMISLKLHDVLGRVVGVLYNGMMPVGRHVLHFDASALHPGSYFYVLQTADHVAKRGLVVVR